MVDASNAFNTINRETFLYSTKILSLSISTYIKTIIHHQQIFVLKILAQ